MFSPNEPAAILKSSGVLTRSWTILLAATLLAGQGARAQLPGGNQAGLNASMLKLFGEFSAFSSKADLRLQEKGAREPMTMTVDFAMLDGKVRVDLDMSTVKSKQIPPEILASYKSAGMDRVATILRPDRKTALLIYPSVQGYVELPMSKEEASDMDRKFKIDKTKLARETIDGQVCDKTKVILSTETGERHEALVWYAPDLKNFPVKMQMDQQQTTVVMQYREVKLLRPNARQFEAPDGFSKYPSVDQLMQKAMLKALGGNKRP